MPEVDHAGGVHDGVELRGQLDGVERLGVGQVGDDGRAPRRSCSASSVGALARPGEQHEVVATRVQDVGQYGADAGAGAR